jgi:hypothetical protein
LLFPSGRFVPSWTRWSVLVFVLYEVWYVFLSTAYLGQFSGAISLVFAVLILSVVGLQIYRYRRVSPFQERQQTRWVVFGLALALGGFGLYLLIGNLFLPIDLLSRSAAGVLLPNTVTDVLLLLVPISIAIAILRARLYEIDTIINKALVYGLLSGALGVLYVGLILGLESLVGQISGNGSQPLVIVVSTLVIAALFHPLRRRIQRLIDRRFYRRKYDAQKIVAAFSATLRHELDLEQLQQQLLAVVRETMQPAHVSLWLRKTGQERKPGRRAIDI